MQQQNINLISTISEQRRAESVKTISLLGALGSWIVVAIMLVIYLLPELSEQNDPRYLTLIVVGIAMAICQTATNFLARRNKLNLAIWISIFTTEITFAIISFMVAHTGLILATISLIIVGNLILQSLSSKAAFIASTIGILGSTITFLIDIFPLNHLRIIPKEWLIETTIIAGGVVFLFLGMELLRHYQFKSVRSQMMVTFIIISIVPLWTITLVQLIRINSLLQSNLYTSISNSAMIIEAANTQIRVTILIATILMFTALAVAIIASNILTIHLNHLINMSEYIKQGKSDGFPAILGREDEIGQLGNILNKTTLELKEVSKTLENRIKAQTLDLEIKTRNIEHQANQLRSVLQITYKIASIKTLNDLLSEITKQINIEYGFYHVAIFLTESTGEYAILKAANGESGQKMLEKGHRIKVGQITNNVGLVTSTGKTNITLDINNETTTFYNPDMPNTHSEIVFPLQIGENIIGALDLQSDKSTIFSIDDINIYSMLANQISIAIENAQLFEEAHTALADAQAFYRQSAATSWRDVLRQGTRGYRYLNGNIEAIKITRESSEKTIDPNIHKKDNQNSPKSLIIPINIRGKNLGTLNIHQPERNHPWSSSEIRVYKSVVDRISFALENARLYQDAQRRATKERVISEIATKVSSSVNMDNILQTAVEELGRVIPGSEIIIQLEHEDETGAETRAQE